MGIDDKDKDSLRSETDGEKITLTNIGDVHHIVDLNKHESVYEYRKRWEDDPYIDEMGE